MLCLSDVLCSGGPVRAVTWLRALGAVEVPPYWASTSSGWGLPGLHILPHTWRSVLFSQEPGVSDEHILGAQLIPTESHFSQKTWEGLYFPWASVLRKGHRNYRIMCVLADQSPWGWGLWQDLHLSRASWSFQASRLGELKFNSLHWSIV